MEAKSCAEKIFLSGVVSVLPDKMIRNVFRVEGTTLHISDLKFSLTDINNIYVIGAGKASALMAKEVEAILGNRISEGHIVVKYNHGCQLNKIKVTEAGHPTPDANGFRASSEILDLLRNADEKDLVLCLLSGGGSSLLTDFPDGSTADELIEMNQLLLKSGADIHEMNAVRKHTSNIKGGQLAQKAYPAQLVSLILSDVIGDSLDVIASGPTSPDTSTFEDALQVLSNYDLTDLMPKSIVQHLTNGRNGLINETPKVGNMAFSKTYNLIIGSNRIALDAARKQAVKMGYHTDILTSELHGDVFLVADYLVKKAIEAQADTNKPKPICLLFGGETTVHVSGKGLGGRNQHLALCTAKLLSGKSGITLLSAGTDGNDGPTDVAGAGVDGNTFPQAHLKNIHPEQYLDEFDSYHFFQKAGGHIITESTLTNVMDIVVILVID